MSDERQMDDQQGIEATLTQLLAAWRGDVAVSLHQASPHYLGQIGGSFGCLLAARLVLAGAPVAYIARDARAAAQAMQDLGALLAHLHPRHLPAPEMSPFEPVRADRRTSLTRAAVLGALGRGEARVLVTSAAGWLKKTPPPEVVRRSALILAVESSVELRDLATRLERLGYQRAPVVEDRGTFAVRGDILDVWPSGAPVPFRIELEFDRVQRIRTFDADTQRSSPSPFEAPLALDPATELLTAPETLARARTELQALCDQVNLPSSRTRLLIDDALSGRALLSGDAFLPAHYALAPLSAHLAPDCILLFEEAPELSTLVKQLVVEAEASWAQAAFQPRFAVAAHFAVAAELDDTLTGRVVVSLQTGAVLGGRETGFHAISSPGAKMGQLGVFSQTELSRRLALSRQGQGASEGLGALFVELSRERERGREVILTARTVTQADRLAQLCEHRGVSVLRESGDLMSLLGRPREPAVTIVVSPLVRGFSSDEPHVFVLTEEEIFGVRSHAPKRSARAALKAALDDLRTLSPGDFVVHAEHGVARYLGLVHRAVDGVTVDLIALEYQAGDKLYVPVYRLNQVQKYSGAGTAPTLDRLGGQTFSRTKSQAQKQVRHLADQLLRLYAERKSATRPPLPPPGDEFAAFEAAFPHEETPDQAAAIADVLADLSREQVMDRLVCGDVGFGKTEVALRAACLTVLGGRQVALLCPTTILAEQHYRAFAERLSCLGAVVRVVSRFQGKKVVTGALLGLKTGAVDVVIGTHRLLSKDVHFKKLGLLVVDEEQRFGVAHKERIKELRRTVDVLTLSATPIPRTLSLSISGLRDMSVINTAPTTRRTIRTFTSRFDDQLIATAMRREVERGGQVFYVVSEVVGIEQRAAWLRELLPGLRVCVGHGQMSERELESTMFGFVSGDFDVLVATTIIESGLDIPRANTMLIERADRFGLAQLYQLRGRVGRASERAYCYLLLAPDGKVTDEARMRIEALERHTELGSGFHIATLDMELRGAGELLGADQSGVLPRVGFDLFAEMLEQATMELSGQEYVADVEPELAVDVEALLPETYVADVGVRLSLYKRYASAESADDVARLSEETEDRFGPPPPEARRFAEVMRLKTELRHLRALGCNASARLVTLHLRDDTPVSVAELAPFVARSAGKYVLTPDGRLSRRTGALEQLSSGLEHAALMLKELAGLARATLAPDLAS